MVYFVIHKTPDQAGGRSNGPSVRRLALLAYIKICVMVGMFGGSYASFSQVIITPLTATASSFYSAGQDPVNLINGSGLTGSYILSMTANADGNANGMWHSDGGQVAGTWVAFDLGKQYALTGMDIWQLNQPGNLGRGAKNFSIYASADGNPAHATNLIGNYSLAIGTGSNGEPLQRLQFPSAATGVRLVKFLITDDWNGFANDYVGLAEVRFETSQVITPVAVTASSYYSADQIPDNLITGNGLLGSGAVLTQTHSNSSTAQGMWHSSGGAVNGSWVTFDLGAQYTLVAADIWQMNQLTKLGRGVKSFGVYTSQNISDPITNFAGGFTLNMGSGTTNEARQFIPFFASSARRVMLVISNDWNGQANDYVGLSEVRFEGGLTTPVIPPITNGLFGYWRFDDAAGSVAADSSGNGNSGSIHNTTGNSGEWTGGVVGGALHFRGPGVGNDYVSIPNVPSSATNGMTLSAWIQTDTNLAGGLVGSIENSAQKSTSAQDALPILRSSWHHVVMMVSGGNITLYRDGLLVASGSYDGALFHAPDTLVLGAHINNNNSLESYFQGSLDEVAFWTRPLLADEMFKVYAAGKNGVSVKQADSFSNSPPLIISAPQGGNFYALEPLSLTVDATGFGTLHYQWFKDGSPLASSDYPVLNNPNAGFDASGQYVAAVTDGNGQSVASPPVPVTITLPQLTIQPVTNGVCISWPAAAAGYILQSAPALGGPWNTATTSSTNSVVLPAGNGNWFYRLKYD